MPDYNMIATKAFDLVEYVKMFQLLLDRKLPPVCIRLLVNMYTSRVTRVEWIDVCSDYFGVRNGVNREELLVRYSSVFILMVFKIGVR